MKDDQVQGPASRQLWRCFRVSTHWNTCFCKLVGLILTNRLTKGSTNRNVRTLNFHVFWSQMTILDVNNVFFSHVTQCTRLSHCCTDQFLEILFYGMVNWNDHSDCMISLTFDFFLYGYVKSQVYENKAWTVCYLQQKIKHRLQIANLHWVSRLSSTNE